MAAHQDPSDLASKVLIFINFTNDTHRNNRWDHLETPDIYPPICAPGTVLQIAKICPKPWLGPCKLTTTRPARPPRAGAESRSFEWCAPTTSCRDPTPASTTPLPAHGPCTARIRTSATAMRTRCGEGDLVGGWHAGASPFMPITRWVTNRGSTSAPFAHAYTPFGRSRRLLDKGSRS